MHDHSGNGGVHELRSREETVATLKYMLRHNEHHAQELRALAHDLEHLGLDVAAAALIGCVNDYECGNAKLSGVLASIGE